MSNKESRHRGQIQQRQATVRSAIQASITGLDEHDLDELLIAARAAGGAPLRELADHLHSHPDALVSGGSAGPRVLLRVLKLLDAAGHPVVLPRCSGCGKQTTELPRLTDAGRICQACGAKYQRRDCDRCGRQRTRIVARRPEGRICYPCYRTDPDRTEPCRGCGRDQHAVVRLADGSALCSRCWTPPQRECARCGRVGQAHYVAEDGPLCVTCYRHHERPRAVCGRCHRMRIVARRGKNGEPDLCESCNTGPTATCYRCGRDRPGHVDNTGEWLCKSCTPRPSRACARCSRSRPVHAHLPRGPVCGTCYAALHDVPAPCAGCREVRVLVGHDDRGSICGPCAGSTLDPRCHTCGTPGRHYFGEKCPRCVLTDRVDKLLSGPDGALSKQLAPVRALLIAAERPGGQIGWLNRSRTAQLLRDLASRDEPITHDYLDTLPQSRPEMFVRQLLVQAGVLPARNDDLERIPPWLDSLLVSQPDHHVRLIRPFAHWFVLRRARRSAARRRHPGADAGDHVRMKIRVALEFLAWLDALHLDLTTTDQAVVDRWLAHGNTPLPRGPLLPGLGALPPHGPGPASSD